MSRIIWINLIQITDQDDQFTSNAQYGFGCIILRLLMSLRDINID